MNHDDNDDDYILQSVIFIDFVSWQMIIDMSYYSFKGFSFGLHHLKKSFITLSD